MNTLITSLIALFLFSTSSFAILSGGDGSSGGGSGYVTVFGKVLLKDFSATPFLSQSINQKLERYYVNPVQETSDLGYHDASSNFFDCAIQKFQESGLSTLEVFAEHLRSFEVYKTSIALEVFFPEYAQENKNYKLIAVYTGTKIFVRDPFYQKMSAKHQCGLAIHEAVRVLSDSKLTSENLKEEDIEEITRLVMFRKNVWTSKYYSILNQGIAVSGKIKKLTHTEEFTVKNGSILVNPFPEDLTLPLAMRVRREFLPEKEKEKRFWMDARGSLVELFIRENNKKITYDTWNNKFTDGFNRRKRLFLSTIKRTGRLSL